MHFRSIIRIVGMLMTLLSVFMLIPAIVALIYRDGGGAIFVRSFFAALILGCLLWLPNRQYRNELNTREGFLIVVLFWMVLGTIGAFPFIFDSHIKLDLTTAFFESFSGLTTTGATTIVGVDNLPKALLFYRQLLQWLGGMGIIVLAVAILPLLGVGGMQLYRAEIPGPQKDTKMQPRIAQTAKMLWFIYILLTVLCSLCLWLAGMNAFDAVSHSFSTISMGGISTHDNSLAYFDSPKINYIVTFFMVLSGCNFGLHFIAFRGPLIKTYWRDQEFRVFIGILLFLIIICSLTIYLSGEKYQHIRFDKIVLQVVSTATTTGFMVTDINFWPPVLPVILLCASFIGGCAGSTGGGLKVVRVLLLFLQGNRELKRLIHPNAIYSLKLNNKVLPERIIESVWGFFSAYAFVFFASFFIIMAVNNVESMEAFYIVSSSLNNLGIGLGGVNDSFTELSNVTKWVMVIDMLFGRLEIFTLLVLFMPAFWRS